LRALVTVMCGTSARMRCCSSRSKPFMTDSTAISTATPSARPSTDSSEMKPTSRLRERSEA
jgi:hypothetical protein